MYRLQTIGHVERNFKTLYYRQKIKNDSQKEDLLWVLTACHIVPLLFSDDAKNTFLFGLVLVPLTLMIPLRVASVLSGVRIEFQHKWSTSVRTRHRWCPNQDLFYNALRSLDQKLMQLNMGDLQSS